MIDVFFSEVLTQTTIGSIEKKVVIPTKNVGLWLEFAFFWKLMEYTNDHSPDVYIIPTF